MGRPGGGGGSHRSSGGHSSGRSYGGHRVGSSSSRPGGGSQRSYSSSHRPSNSRPPVHRPPVYRPPVHRPPRPHISGSGAGYRGSSSCSSVILTMVILFVIIMIVIGSSFVSSAGSGSIPSSSYNREKLASNIGYENDCIVDELGWLDNESRTESRLKTFYEKTGIQPYIILLDYHPELKTESQMEEYALQLYDEYIDNEATFLYVYFSDPELEMYNEPGYMCYVNGKQVGSVMDSEAVEIFWAYIDKYWYSDLSTDDMFVKAFDSTATRIMKKTTTGKDVMKYVLIVAAAGVVVFGVIKVVKLKHQRAKEEAAETERILNTPIESLVEQELKETAKKYDNDSSSSGGQN